MYVPMESYMFAGSLRLIRTDLQVRLAKVIRSLYIFEQADLMASAQKYARDIHAHEKNGRPFRYGGQGLGLNVFGFYLPPIIPFCAMIYIQVILY